MNYRALGRTGLSVSAVSLGTVSLGVEYGINAPGEFGRPDEAAAVRLLEAAVERGITLFDTAPVYGDSERLIGRAIGSDSRAIVATKITPSRGDADPSRSSAEQAAPQRQAIMVSLDASRRALRRDRLDVVQIHNATREMIEAGDVTDALLDAQRRGIVGVLGASVYGEEAALAVVRSGYFAVLQVALNVLDQRMAARVLPAAAAAGIGVIVRSAFLKGALTRKAQWLPAELAVLRGAAQHACDLLADGEWDDLPVAAMRFCLSMPHVASVLTGARTIAELDVAIASEAAGPFDEATLASAADLAVDEERLVNPSYWPVP